jgi:hypothetical protein
LQSGGALASERWSTNLDVMDFAVVPTGVGTKDALIWVGAIGDEPADPADVWLEHRASGARWQVTGWDRWQEPAGLRSLRHQRVPLIGLTPATRYAFNLRVAGQVRAEADVTTLPATLPGVQDPPFIVLLGSCFCRAQDASGRVGKTVAQLPDGAKPTIKFLVGDQVYLDSPWYCFTYPRWNDDLARSFFDQYVQTWTQTGDGQGFNHLLRSGATYFCSDDHEFWNNAPFPSVYAVNTWTDVGRRAWWDTALALYRAFQTTSTRTSFRVGALEFLVLDTRLNRDPYRQAFLSRTDFAAFQAWVAGLSGPGVLVLGQPVFADRAGVRGNIADWNLPDFAQYRDLCRVLLSSRQSVVVLTGDVHYGRIASATLPSGADLVEIIASPMALVDRAAGGRWNAAPQRFPAMPLEGIASVGVRTDAGWNRFANHFVTLEFNDKAGGVRLRVRSWETEPSGTSLGRTVLAELVLKRNV